MTTFPNVSEETSKLHRFLAEWATGKLDVTPQSQQLRSAAERLIVRLESPVRVAMVGDRGAGKSSLMNFLVGDALIPTGEGQKTVPSVIVSYAHATATVSGWWGGKRVNRDGIELAKALEENPDYIEFSLPNPLLENVTFFDMPGARDAARQKKQLAWLLQRADIILWCQRAGTPWTTTHQDHWAQAPERLKKSSFLIATHVDKAPETGAAAIAQLKKDAGKSFAGVLPMATEAAIAAAPGGVVSDQKAWMQSGARDLIMGILGQARIAREAAVLAAQQLIETGIEKLGEPVAEPPAAQEPAPDNSAELLAAMKSSVKRPEPKEEVPADVAADEPEVPVEEKSEKPQVDDQPTTDDTPVTEEPAPEEAAAEPEEVVEAAEPEPKPTMPRRVGSPFAAFRKSLEEIAELDEQVEDAAEAPEPEPEPSEEALTEPVVEEKVVEEIPVSPEPDLVFDTKMPENEIARFLTEKIDTLIAQANSGTEVDTEEFVSVCCETVEELSFQIANPKVLKPDSAWLNDEVQDAAELLVALRFDGGDRAVQDAAAILLQLSRDLSETLAA